MMLLIAACTLVTEPSTVVKLEQVDVIKLPAWEIESSSLDAECGGLLQFCVRSVCTVRSTDPEPTAGNLVFTLDQRQGHYTRRERVELDPKQQAKVTSTFPEAKLLGGESKGGCDIERTGTRIECNVANAGSLPHEVEIVARLTDAAGAPSSEQRQLVTVAPGQREPVRFLFDKLNVAGTCEIVER